MFSWRVTPISMLVLKFYLLHPFTGNLGPYFLFNLPEIIRRYSFALLVCGSCLYGCTCYSLQTRFNYYCLYILSLWKVGQCIYRLFEINIELSVSTLDNVLYYPGLQSSFLLSDDDRICFLSSNLLCRLYF